MLAASRRCLSVQVSQVGFHTSPFTFLSSGVAPAADAGSGSLLALVRVSVTLAGPAAGEAPVTRLASVAALPEGPRAALALPGELVAESGHGAVQAAFTGWADRGGGGGG